MVDLKTGLEIGLKLRMGIRSRLSESGPGAPVPLLNIFREAQNG